MTTGDGGPGSTAIRSPARVDAARIERALRRLTWSRGAVRDIADGGNMQNSFRLIRALSDAVERTNNPAGHSPNTLARDRLFLRLFADALEDALDRADMEGAE